MDNPMLRVEYSTLTRADRELAWEVFSDWRLWPRFSDIYQNLRWVGTPWEVGSRLRIDITEPLPATVDHVIIACCPGESVGWIDHVFGNSMEQWVLFETTPHGTEIHTWADVTGCMPVIAGRKAGDLLREFFRGWYTRFAAECDRRARGGNWTSDRHPWHSQ